MALGRTCVSTYADTAGGQRSCYTTLVNGGLQEAVHDHVGVAPDR